MCQLLLFDRLMMVVSESSTAAFAPLLSRHTCPCYMFHPITAAGNGFPFLAPWLHSCTHTHTPASWGTMRGVAVAASAEWRDLKRQPETECGCRSNHSLCPLPSPGFSLSPPSLHLRGGDARVSFLSIRFVLTSPGWTPHTASR